MNKIFISYSRFDLEVVDRIVKTIEQNTGANCWVDLTGIESGSLFEDKIIQAIDNADVLLFMMSDQSLKSPWAKREVFYAEEKGKRVIPVSLDGKSLRGWAQFHFGNVNFIDASSKEQMEKLLSDLRSWTDGSIGTDNAPVSPHPKRWGRWVIPVGIAVISLILFLALWERRRTEQGGRYGGQGPFNSHEWVDLGTGVKWATCNVGASTPEAYGAFFAWGETSPKSEYKWDNYKFLVTGDSWSNVTFSKYSTRSNRGAVDDKTRLDYGDDAARVIWGGSWRIPTRSELDELLTKCTWTWTTQGGKNGYKVTSKTNGNSIFLPAAGYQLDGTLYDCGSVGYYWSSSLFSSNPFGAHSLRFSTEEVEWYIGARRSGFPIRPVSE